jgi:hypothetical protein
MITEIALSKDNPNSPTWSTQFIFIPERAADLPKLVRLFSLANFGPLRGYVSNNGNLDTVMSPAPGVEMTEYDIAAFACFLHRMQNPTDQLEINGRVRELSV